MRYGYKNSRWYVFLIHRLVHFVLFNWFVTFVVGVSIHSLTEENILILTNALAFHDRTSSKAALWVGETHRASVSGQQPETGRDVGMWGCRDTGMQGCRLQSPALVKPEYVIASKSSPSQLQMTYQY